MKEIWGCRHMVEARHGEGKWRKGRRGREMEAGREEEISLVCCMCIYLYFIQSGECACTCMCVCACVCECVCACVRACVGA